MPTTARTKYLLLLMLLLGGSDVKRGSHSATGQSPIPAITNTNALNGVSLRGNEVTPSAALRAGCAIWKGEIASLLSVARKDDVTTFNTLVLAILARPRLCVPLAVRFARGAPYNTMNW